MDPVLMRGNEALIPRPLAKHELCACV
jgi:hypothetical protein